NHVDFLSYRAAARPAHSFNIIGKRRPASSLLEKRPVSLVCQFTLEGNLQRKLDLTLWRRGDHAGNGSEGRSLPVHIRHPKVRGISDIEEFGAKLRIQTIEEPHVLHHRSVQVHNAGSAGAGDGTPHGSKRVGGGRGEGSSIEPFRHAVL